MSAIVDDGAIGCRGVVASGIGMACCVDVACCVCSKAGCCSGIGLGLICCSDDVGLLASCCFFKGVPQYLQNKSVSLFSFPQLTQNMILPSSR